MRKSAVESLVTSNPIARRSGITQTAGESSSSNEASLSLQILHAHRSALIAFARQLGNSRDDAEDLVQDTMLRAWHARETFKGGNLKAWLFTILRNRYYGELRTGRVRYERVGDYVEMGATEPALGCAGADLCDLLLMLDRIRALPKDQREVFLLALMGDEYQMIADLLQVPVGTVKSRLFRAREALTQ